MSDEKRDKKVARPSKKKSSFEKDEKAAPAVKEKPPEKKPVEEKPKHCELKKWNDLDMYQCLHCNWNTLNPDDMVAHIADHLKDKEPIIRRTDTGIIDVRGDKYFREEVVGLKDDDNKEV